MRLTKKANPFFVAGRGFELKTSIMEGPSLGGRGGGVIGLLITNTFSFLVLFLHVFYIQRVVFDVMAI